MIRIRVGIKYMYICLDTCLINVLCMCVYLHILEYMCIAYMYIGNVYNV